MTLPNPQLQLELQQQHGGAGNLTSTSTYPNHKQQPISTYHNNPWMKERAKKNLGCSGMKSYYQKAEEKRIARLRSIKSVISTKLNSNVNHISKRNTNNIHKNINANTRLNKGKSTFINNTSSAIFKQSQNLNNCPQSQSVSRKKLEQFQQQQQHQHQHYHHQGQSTQDFHHSHPHQYQQHIAEKGIDPTFLPYYATANAINAMPNFLYQNQRNNKDLYSGGHEFEQDLEHEQSQSQRSQPYINIHSKNHSLPSLDTPQHGSINAQISNYRSKESDSPLKKALQGIGSAIKEKSPLRSFYRKDNSNSTQKKGNNNQKIKLSPLKKGKAGNIRTNNKNNNNDNDDSSSLKSVLHNQNNSIDKTNLKT